MREDRPADLILCLYLARLILLLLLPPSHHHCCCGSCSYWMAPAVSGTIQIKKYNRCRLDLLLGFRKNVYECDEALSVVVMVAIAGGHGDSKCKVTNNQNELSTTSH